MRRAWSDHPYIFDALGLVIIGAWSAGSARWGWWQPSEVFTESARGRLDSALLGLAGAASMAAGLAGVVIVFSLSTTSAAFQKFRARAGGRLHLSLIWPTAMSFLAAGAALTAALLADPVDPSPGVWVGIAALLVLTHAVARFLWLMSSLARIVLGDDARAQQKSKQIEASAIVKRPNR